MQSLQPAQPSHDWRGVPRDARAPTDKGGKSNPNMRVKSKSPVVPLGTLQLCHGHCDSVCSKKGAACRCTCCRDKKRKARNGCYCADCVSDDHAQAEPEPIMCPIDFFEENDVGGTCAPNLDALTEFATTSESKDLVRQGPDMEAPKEVLERLRKASGSWRRLLR